VNCSTSGTCERSRACCTYSSWTAVQRAWPGHLTSQQGEQQRRTTEEQPPWGTFRHAGTPATRHGDATLPYTSALSVSHNPIHHHRQLLM
jgi:hypothetical protein